MPEHKDRDERDKRETREIKIDLGGDEEPSRNAWMEALQELEGATPEAKPPRKESSGSSRSESDTPGRESTVRREDKPFDQMVEETAEAIVAARDVLERFQKKNPHLFAPNIIRHWQESLKETKVILERQQQREARGNGSPQNGRQNNNERETR